VLVNCTSGNTLALDVLHCDTFWKRLRGLMFRRPLRRQEAYLFSYRRQSVSETTIHMLFVFFPISVLWLDADRRVVDVTLAKPFRPFYAPKRPAQYFVEGAPVLLEQVHIGDQLAF
jgi:uncharacterized membrane protein (UPF0127 family)